MTHSEAKAGGLERLGWLEASGQGARGAGEALGRCDVKRTAEGSRSGEKPGGGHVPR